MRKSCIVVISTFKPNIKGCLNDIGNWPNSKKLLPPIYLQQADNSIYLADQILDNHKYLLYKGLYTIFEIIFKDFINIRMKLNFVINDIANALL